MIEAAIRIILQAGSAILKVYTTEFTVITKTDTSPLTEADMKSHHILETGLKDNYPVLSEESDAGSFDDRRNWSTFWLIDPLDGTKEFIKRNGEFTVNVALIEHGEPVFGLVYVPVTDVLYIGHHGKGAWIIENASAADLEKWESFGKKLPCKTDPRPFTIVASRSHLSSETEKYIAALQKEHPDCVSVSAGSSLKLCMVAEGSADIYPRFAPTMEWDTAAADAVCRAAGCTVSRWSEKVSRPDGPLVYNKEDLHNPWFIVTGKNGIKG